MNTKKDMTTLINLSRKFGQAFCDKDTFEEISSNHIVQQWKYQSDAFKITFPTTQSNKTTVNNYYAKLRRKLKEINLAAPSESSMRLVSNFARVEELVLLDELWEELGTDDES
jgi:hypothetical protein